MGFLMRLCAPFLVQWALSVCLAALTVSNAIAQPVKPSWDVNKPPGVARTVAIDTSTGTWMSVDVSPDGKTLVFDLLGDLYLLPIEGGQAQPLTSSIAWEHQARFSRTAGNWPLCPMRAEATTFG